MPRIVHIVATDGFAGVERYICDVAAETCARGWDVAVVGGDSLRMRRALDDAVRWEPGMTTAAAARSVLRLGRADIAHAHMTVAEAVAVATRLVHRAPVVATRHFAAPRGATCARRVVLPVMARSLTREIAISEFVAQHLERPPSAVVVNGVPETRCLWRSEHRVLLVLQRLEPEKDTMTALRVWKASQMSAEGWSMHVVGEGSQRAELIRRADAEGIEGVTFLPWTEDVPAELARTGILLAPALAEPLGLSVLEAMAAGVPVVASASGGHLETIGRVSAAPLFPPGDVQAGAAALRGLRDDNVRGRLSATSRALVAERFTIGRHVDGLLREYDVALGGRGVLRGRTDRDGRD